MKTCTFLLIITVIIQTLKTTAKLCEKLNITGKRFFTLIFHSRYCYNYHQTQHHNNKCVLYLVPCVHLTLNCCLFSLPAHVLVLVASLYPLQLSGTTFLWSFAVVFQFSFRQNSLTFFYNLAFWPP